MTTYPLRLEGFILHYVDGCSPAIKVFKSMEELELFVGKFFLKNHRSDDHWIETIAEGVLYVVDEGIRIETDEDPNLSAEPENEDELDGTSEGGEEFDDLEELAGTSGSSGEHTGVSQHSEHHGCEYACTESCQPKTE